MIHEVWKLPHRSSNTREREQTIGWSLRAWPRVANKKTSRSQGADCAVSEPERRVSESYRDMQISFEFLNARGADWVYKPREKFNQCATERDHLRAMVSWIILIRSIAVSLGMKCGSVRVASRVVGLMKPQILQPLSWSFQRMF